MPNVLLNPSFEVDETDWTASTSNTTIVRSTTSPFVGSGCGLWTRSAGSGNMVLISSLYPASAGQDWSAGVQVALSAGTARNVRCDIRFYNSSGSDIGGSLGSSVTAGASYDQPKAEGVTAPADTTHVRIRVVALSAASGNAFRIDALQLEQGATLPAYNEGGGSVDLAPADAAHGHTADVPTLTQAHELVPADSTHGHASDSPTLAQQHTLAPASSIHGHTAEVPALSQVGDLAPADATHGHAAESPTLTQVHALVPADTAHGHATDQPVLVVAGASPNMLYNSSFEFDFGGLHEDDTPPANWEGNPVDARTRVNDPANAWDGDWVGILSNPDGRAAPNWQSEDASYSACAPGEVLTASCYVKKYSGSSTFVFRQDVQWFDATDTPIAGAFIGANVVPTGTYQRVVGTTGPAPAGTTHAQVRLTLQSATFGDAVYVDAAQLERGTEATAYVATGDLAPADSGHGHVVESPTLAQVHVLEPAESTHGHAATSPTLTTGTTLQPADSVHAHASEQPTLTQAHELAPDDCEHEHAVEAPALTQVHEFAPADSVHSHVADSPLVVVPSGLPPPAANTVVTPAEVRILAVAAESRIVTTPAETRIITD